MIENNRYGATFVHRESQRQTSRRAPRSMPRMIRTAITLALVSAISVLAAACATFGNDVDLSRVCLAADTPFTRYVSEGGKPPWATAWHATPFSAATDFTAPQESLSDQELIEFAAECAGVPHQTWNELTTAEAQQHTDVVVGTQNYLYRASTADGDGGRHILAVVVQRTGESSAKFAVQAMPVVGQFPTSAPTGAAVVQSLRSNGLL